MIDLRRSLLGVLFAGITFVPAAMASEPIGSISKVDPAATITAPGADPAIVNLNATVSMADVVRTDVNGFVKIVFKDGSELTVNPGGNVTIDEFVFDGTTRSGKLVLSIGVGVARFVGGNMKKENIKIRTPTATLGLRGTDLVIRIDGSRTEVEVLHGGIVLTPCDIKDVHYLADAGDVIGVDFSCAVSIGPAGVASGGVASAAAASPGPSGPGPGDPGGPSGGPGNGNGNEGNSGNGGGNTGGSGPGTGNGDSGTGNGGSGGNGGGGGGAGGGGGGGGAGGGGGGGGGGGAGGGGGGGGGGR